MNIFRTFYYWIYYNKNVKPQVGINDKTGVSHNMLHSLCVYILSKSEIN